MTQYDDRSPSAETLAKWIDEEVAKRLKVCWMRLRLEVLHVFILLEVFVLV